MRGMNRPHAAWCRVERRTEEKTGHRGPCFPSPPPPRLGWDWQAETSARVQGRRRTSELMTTPWRLVGRMGRPTIQTSLLTSFTDIFSSPAPRAVVPTTTWACGANCIASPSDLSFASRPKRAPKCASGCQSLCIEWFIFRISCW